MIELKDVSKTYEKHCIFRNFNLTVCQGEFVIISGESGSGKTTLLNMIGALEMPDSGTVRIRGKEIRTERDRRIYWRQTAGFLFQQFALVENKTVQDNLKMIRKQDRSGISFDEALEMTGLSGMGSRKIYMLSGGEQQRVALARLLVKQTAVILADEPTGSLDRKNAQKVMDLLLEMNRMGKTVLMVTHDEEMKKKGDRVIEIENS